MAAAVRSFFFSSDNVFATSFVFGSTQPLESLHCTATELYCTLHPLLPRHTVPNVRITRRRPAPWLSLTNRYITPEQAHKHAHATLLCFTQQPPRAAIPYLTAQRSLALYTSTSVSASTTSSTRRRESLTSRRPAPRPHITILRVLHMVFYYRQNKCSLCRATVQSPDITGDMSLTGISSRAIGILLQEVISLVIFTIPYFLGSTYIVSVALCPIAGY